MFVSGILLFITIFFWSTIKLVFLSAIGYIFTYLAIKYRAEGRNFLVVSVIGLILSFIILVQFSTPIVSQLGETQAQVTEVVEENQNMFERLWSKLEEPAEPEEPSFFEKYIPIVIIFNAINLVLIVLTVFTSQEAFMKSAKQFNVRVVHASTPPESSNPNYKHYE